MSERAPLLPPSVPRRGNAVTRAIGRAALWLMGWKTGRPFPDVPKMMLVGYPHTSNWDGVVAVLGSMAYGVEAHFFAKREAFAGPVGWLLRLFGGIPIDRDKPGGLVKGAVEEYQRRDAFAFGMTPEGTRGPSDGWKTGFHRVALAAGIPVVPIYFDHGRRVIGPGPAIPMTGDLSEDLARVIAAFEGVVGKHPENATPPSPAQLGAQTDTPAEERESSEERES